MVADEFSFKEESEMQCLYPNGLKKALTFSYDDGMVFDRRLVGIFDKYGLKATFHLNSGNLDHDGYVTKKEVGDLYKNHEVACHTVHHVYMAQIPNDQLISEILNDRKSLEELVGYPVRGMSYPFGEYSENIIRTLGVLGIEYSRTVQSHGGFMAPCDFLRWNPTCHHNDALKKVDEFLNPPEYMRMPLFYVWGHSFEFDRQNTWDMMETFCAKVSGKDDVWYATNLQIKRYLSAVRSLVFSVGETMVYNPSAVPVWLEANGRVLQAEPGKTLIVES